MVPPFSGRVEVDLHVPCSYDMAIGSAKYFHAVRDGEIPVLFLFSGSAFVAHEPAAGVAGWQIEPVPWDLEAWFRLPARVWTHAMDQFFPGGGWLRLRRDTIDRLQAFRARRAIIEWDDAIDELLMLQPESQPS
jgi:hypothetical protein